MAIKYDYEIGKQVICTIGEGGMWPDSLGIASYKGPVRGQVLTISGIKDYRPHGVDTLGLQFYEFKIQTLGGEASFACQFFRPVKSTSIECFNQILEKVDRQLSTPVDPNKDSV